jgi:phosphoribosylformylglycinamidine (FGAM) synthase PurS component
MTVTARVHRKTRDLVRDAAEDVLRPRVPALAGLDRAELWVFEGEDGAEKDVRRLLDETTLVVNPNLHRYRLDGAGSRPERGTRLEIVVHDRVDAKGAAVLRNVRERRGIRTVTGVRRSVVWTIDVDGPAEEAERLAREVTGRDGRGAGLLANPHSQEVEWTVTGA